jgi:hypothetical protein
VHARLLTRVVAIVLDTLQSVLRELVAAAPIVVEVFSDALHALGPIEAAQRAADATRAVVAKVS